MISGWWLTMDGWWGLNVPGEGEADVKEYALFSGFLVLDVGAFEWNRKETHCEGINGVC